MDHRSFDSLARSLAAPKSRRGLLGSLAALGGGLLGGRSVGAQQVTQVYCGNQFCASNPGGCKPGCVCCVYTNAVTGTVTNSRCRPPGTCSPGTEAGGPAPTTTTTTTTTTAAPNPFQGTCLAGQDTCFVAEVLDCNGSGGCTCSTHISGVTVCRGSGICQACSADADCAAFGAGNMCFSAGGDCGCATACAKPCPVGFP